MSLQQFQQEADKVDQVIGIKRIFEFLKFDLKMILVKKKVAFQRRSFGLKLVFCLKALEAIHKKAMEAKKTIEELILMLNREDKVHW